MKSHFSWKQQKKGSNSKKWTKKIFNFLLKQIKQGNIVKNLILLGVALLFIGLIMSLALFAWFSKDLPDPDSLSIRQVAQSTKIYDSTGENLLYEISGDEKRTLVPIEEIPDYMIEATITAEDRKFYDHNGIDYKGILRAIFKNVTSFNPTGQGASTITQQLVKNAILTNEKTIGRKVKEIILSIALERRYTKEEILQLYLNEIAYGSTNYGIESASKAYFDKSSQDLSIAEAATLAALPKAPSTFLNNPDRLKIRRDWILESMYDLEYLTEDELSTALAEETEVSLSLTNIDAPHFVLWVKEQLEQEYGEKLVEQGGLSVTTSLDFEMQEIAEEAVLNNIEARSSRYGFNNSGLVALDPKTGHILAMVGSADYFDDEIDGQVNVSLQPLQPGSSFKPIVYTAAFEKGYTPNSILWDVNTTFPTATGPYSPKNYDLSEHGPMTIRKSLQGSLNVPAVKMLSLIGVENGLNFAEKLHYSTFTDRARFGLAIVLGGGEVKLLEHVSAYGIFATEGIYHEPISILKVEDHEGNILEEWKESEGEQALETNIARMITNVLSDNNARAYAFGLNTQLVLPGRKVAAKTGTTNNYKDAWTIGYTPSLVAGVWTGNTDGSEMNRGSGGSTVAAPIWNEFMRRALEGQGAESFNSPSIPITGKAILDGVIPSETITIDTASGKLATDRTPDRFKETKTCGDYRTILYYINPSNPTGEAPKKPEKNGQYSAWQEGVQSYLTRQNEEQEEGQPILEVCEIPTEEDDLHLAKYEPNVRVKSPKNGDEFNRTITVSMQAAAVRGISRVEYMIDGQLAYLDFDPFGASFSLPSWINAGTHTLTVYAFDDIDNKGSDSVVIQVTEAGNLEQVSITNPFENQIIEKISESDDKYKVAIEVRNAFEMKSLSVSIQNLWTGSKQTIFTTNNVSSLNLAEWTLLSEAEYIVRASGVKEDGSTVDSTPIRVTVQKKSGNNPQLELVPQAEEEEEITAE